MSGLVFVEGVPGTGKSTTAQFLARQLSRHGRPARWFYEEQVPNPFVPEIDPSKYRDWQHFIDLRVERWQAFARAAAVTTETLVAESVLLQLPVFTMLRRDVSPAMIERLLIELARTVAPLHPKLVYLAHPKPEEAWRAIAEQRGAEFVAGAVRRSNEWAFLHSRGLSGLPGVLAYWRGHGALCDEIVSRLPMETLTVDMSDGSWPERRARICTFLDVAADEPAAQDPGTLAHVTGRYRNGERELTVTLDGGRLVLRGRALAIERPSPCRTQSIRRRGVAVSDPVRGGCERARTRTTLARAAPLVGRTGGRVPPRSEGARMTPLTFTTTDGVHLVYAVDDFTDPWKDAPTVVLLHAAMSNLRRFYAWVPALARDLRVVRLDLRGHGDSETPGPDLPISIDRVGRDVVELLDHLRLACVHVSGSSAGGYVAQWLAINAPERVAKLALFSTTPGLSHARPSARVPTWPGIVRAKGVDVLIAETVAARVDPTRVDAGFIRWMVEQAGRMDREFTARFLATMAALDLSARLHEIKAPTLIVVAGADTVCSVEGYELLRRIPDHRWVVYDGQPHNITNAVPERCALELRRFLVG